jgi:hypothetical protein
MGLKHARTREKGRGAKDLSTSRYLLLVFAREGMEGGCNLSGEGRIE